MRVLIDVPQSAAERADAAATCRCRSPTNDGVPLVTGQVTRNSESMNPQARTLRVEVDLPNARTPLVPGMYVNVSFELPTRGQVQVPAAALEFRAGGPQVARIPTPPGASCFTVTIARDDGATWNWGQG